MGHLRLDRLPRTHRWQQVVELLEEGASAKELAEITSWAAHKGLDQVPNDPGFTQTLTAIFGFVDAIQSKNPEAALRKAGFEIPENASLVDYVSGFKERARKAAIEARARSDIAEIAQNSFAKVLVATAGSSAQSLFGIDAAQSKQALHDNLKASALGKTMHEFFAGFTSEYLNYYLGRELPNHVGKGRTFANTGKHSEFDKSFNLFVRQTVRIADEFTPGWFGKARWEGRLSHGEVSKYAHVAFKKIRAEFKRSAKDNG